MSDKTLEFSEQLNPNTEFLNGRGFWAFYASIVILAHLFIKLFVSIVFPDLSPHALTITNGVHAIVTLYAMHWLKGASFSAPFGTVSDNGKYDKLTWWEQLDNGQQNTTKKKILTTIPISIATLACLESAFDPQWVLINFAFAVVAILGKLPFMHRVRILNINH